MDLKRMKWNLKDPKTKPHKVVANLVSWLRGWEELKNKAGLEDYDFPVSMDFIGIVLQDVWDTMCLQEAQLNVMFKAHSNFNNDEVIKSARSMARDIKFNYLKRCLAEVMRSDDIAQVRDIVKSALERLNNLNGDFLSETNRIKKLEDELSEALAESYKMGKALKGANTLLRETEVLLAEARAEIEKQKQKEVVDGTLES